MAWRPLTEEERAAAMHLHGAISAATNTPLEPFGIDDDGVVIWRTWEA